MNLLHSKHPAQEYETFVSKKKKNTLPKSGKSRFGSLRPLGVNQACVELGSNYSTLYSRMAIAFFIHLS
jgi:hypothetical protein